MIYQAILCMTKSEAQVHVVRKQVTVTTIVIAGVKPLYNQSEVNGKRDGQRPAGDHQPAIFMC